MNEPHEWLAQRSGVAWFCTSGDGVGVAVAFGDGGLLVTWGQDLEDAVEDQVLGRVVEVAPEEISRLGFLYPFMAAVGLARERRLADAA